MSETFATVEKAIRAAASNPLPETIRKDHSFLLDLGFDSLTITVLTLELEHFVGQPVLLNRWVESASNPTDLTVGSLCAYLEQVVSV
ncbi:hypothetical protein DL240_16000 [Lujinxingia litoralis]|uniref:Carrier domain-containing protein n=1 Tax=Lujinxingia litoralis TaxID=2211119 RepID=A0A328C3Y9_9DELT|nr:hypothetical protein [Lujinxingia litoralis]RAL20542.1 hypothetical protein DL240_16000 [Lujinxingia litoralis]